MTRSPGAWRRASIRAVRGDLNPWWRVGVPLAVAAVRLLFRTRVSGIHHVPLEGPGILAFNHVSVLDGPCLAVETAWRRRRETRFLVAAEVYRHPVPGWFLRRYDQIPIRRGTREYVGGTRQGLDRVALYRVTFKGLTLYATVSLTPAAKIRHFSVATHRPL